MMTALHGLSGAQVFLVDGEAIKVNHREPTRVVEQGQWLAVNAAQHLPAVVKIMPRGYAMEQLDAIRTGDVNLSTMCEALELSVWSNAGTHDLDTSTTVEKVSLILDKHASHLREFGADAVTRIQATRSCLTHGDPTAENVMLRADGTYVLIDPLPSTPAIPDDMAVDCGKLLQSAHGWEELKGEEPSSWRPADVRLHFDAMTFEVGKLWCIVHFIRTLPYASEEVRARVIEKLEELVES